ncbi:SusE domain-containing protein [Hymenobacter sp. B1770]|uniref:SusE domain-containing protein n=1 Tax=Hymenobacter sp. B1770 TaxID=1718788 RepID=UPI003CF73F92
MKNWLTQVVAGLLAVSTLASCEKDEDKVTITPSNTITLSTSANTVVLTQANSARNAATFTWNPISSFTLSGTDRNTPPAASYRLQVAKSATGFGYPANIEAGAGNTKSVTVEELNSALLNLGLAPDVAAQVFVRVAAVVGTDAQAFVSNPVQMTVTPYKVCLPPNTDTWGLVGPAGDGWPGATDTDRVLNWDCDAKAYVLRTTLNAGAFKFRKDKKWDINLGGSGNPFAGAIPLTLNGSDMVAIPGTYTIKLEVTGSGANVSAGRLTITP